jgi:hypothetical protein
MEQAADAPRCLQLIVGLDRFLSWGDMNLEPTSLEKRQGFRANVKGAPKTLGKDDDLGAVVEQLFNVSGLDTGQVMSVCLAPIPRPPATGKEFGILVSAAVLGLKMAPRDARDPRAGRNLTHRSYLPDWIREG